MVALFWCVIALLMSSSNAFITPSPRLPSTRKTQLASTAEATEYDIVKVDLADGRDYPIYIGAGYGEDEGKKHGISLKRCAARCLFRVTQFTRSLYTHTQLRLCYSLMFKEVEY